MLLSGEEIQKNLGGNIIIEPYHPSQLNPNSYNLRLSNELLVYDTDTLDMKANNPVRHLTIPDSGLLLETNKLYLGRTLEYTKTEQFVPMLEGRSSVGRLGLFIHVTAGFGDVGFAGYWTLEMFCIHPIVIYPNVEICQIYYHTIQGEYQKYDSGKYQNNTGGDYEFSLGLNGLGSCATQYSSEYFDAIIRRDGFKYTLHFEKGELVGKMKKEPTDRKATGSIFRWKPDLAVFTDINIPKEYFEDTLKRQAVVNAGVTFTFRDQENGKFVKTDYCYPNGILDYVNEIAGEQTLTMPQFWEAERKGRDREDKPEYKVRISAALCFSNRVNRIEYYHNSSWLEHGGAPEKAVKNAFVYAIDAYCKQTNKYTKSESKITFQDVADCLVLVTNCFSTQTSYENQTKKAITNKFVQDAMAEFFRDRLHVYFIENKQEADRIADQVLVNKRSRESAEKARLNIKKKLTGNLDIANRVQKFVDCRTKDVSKREIYIVEGDSALGSVKLSRDAEFQGIMPVRGKILNCLKADYDRIFKSDIITDLIRVLGCGVEVQTKKTKDLSAFDLENLRWNKVIICTDADVDGYQIRTLILTMIYRLCPTLIQEGYVYIAESPLYEITCKDKTWFAYTDAEKAEIVKKLEGKKLSINRSKGLGENDPEMMWMTTMNPATRRLIKVMPEDMERTMQIFDLLLGDNLQGRKEHIAENGYKYLDQLDVS